MGALGSMLGGLATSAAGFAFSGVTGLLGGLAKMLLGAITSSLRAGLGLIISLPGRLIGGIVGAFQTGTSLVSSLINGTFGVIRAAIDGAFNLLRTGVTAFAGAAALLVSGAKKAVDAATAFGRTIGDVRAATGSGNMGRFSAFGLSGKDIAGMLENQNPMLFGMKAGVFGLPNYNSNNFLPALASHYQGMNDGGMGTMMARAQLRSLGLDNAQVRRIATTPVSDIVSQQNYQSNAQQRMGLNPGLLEKATRQFDLLIQRVKIFADTALQRLGQELLPKINAILKVATDYQEQHGEQVQDVIVSAVRSAWQAFLGLGRFLYADLPPMVLGIADSFLSGIEIILKALPTLWENFLHGLDIVQQALGNLPDLIAQGWDYVQQVFTNGFHAIGGMLGNVVNSLSADVQQIGSQIQQVFDTIAQHPLIQSILKAVPAVAGFTAEASRIAGGAGATIAKGLGADEGGQEAARLGAGSAAVKYLLNGGAQGLLPHVAKYGLQGGRWLWGGLKAAQAVGAQNTLLSYLFGLPQATASGVLSAASAPVVAAGAILGGVGYTGLQRTGILGKEAPGFWEAANNTRKRISNLITRNDYNYDVTEMNGYTAIDNARTRAAQNSMAPVRNALRVIGARQKSQQLGQNTPGTNLPFGIRPPFGFSLPSLSVSSRGARGNFLTNLLQDFQNAPRGSWSQSLDQRFGGAVRGHSAEALGTVQGLHGELRDMTRKVGSSDDRNRQFDRFEKLLQNIENNTKTGANAALDTVDAMGPMAERIIARAAAYNAQDAALTLLRTR